MLNNFNFLSVEKLVNGIKKEEREKTFNAFIASSIDFIPAIDSTQCNHELIKTWLCNNIARIDYMNAISLALKNNEISDNDALIFKRAISAQFTLVMKPLNTSLKACYNSFIQLNEKQFNDGIGVLFNVSSEKVNAFLLMQQLQRVRGTASGEFKALTFSQFKNNLLCLLVTMLKKGGNIAWGKKVNATIENIENDLIILSGDFNFNKTDVDEICKKFHYGTSDYTKSVAFVQKLIKTGAIIQTNELKGE